MPFDISTVPGKFIDVDFRAQPEYVMGDLGPKPELLGTMRAYEDAFPTLIHPRSQWKQLAAEAKAKKAMLANLVTRIFNQGREGSCVGNAETQMMQILWAAQFGKSKVVQLSPSSAYQLIGSSPGSGANVADAMRKGCQVGIIPLDTPENRAKFNGIVMPATGFYERRPAGWQLVAKDFRFDEDDTFIIRTLEGLVSAQFNGHPVQVGREGHSILYTDPVFDGDSLRNLYANSWGQWGVGAGDFSAGFGLDTERQMIKSSGWAFACRSVVVPSWILAA